jgi:NADPH-dependent curcumin reductase CurA
MTVAENRRILLTRHPEGEPGDDCFEVIKEPAPEPGEGQALVRVTHLSVDPAQRIWLNPGGAYAVGTPLGGVVLSLGVGAVVATRSDAHQVGDRVTGMLGWQDYALVDSAVARVAPVRPGLDAAAALNVFGLNGQTAYWGLFEIGRPQAGETVVVSAAAGATGSLVGQLARIAGARVVGLAGSAAKRAWITDELGFDAALDHRAPDLAEALAQACPDGVDVFFDNVGGPVLDLALARLNLRGRVVLCGAISAYNDNVWGPGPSQYRQLIRQRGRMEGFIVMDYAPRYGEALDKLVAWEAQGLLRHREELVDGLEAAPEALRRVLRGEHLGKLVVVV